MIRYFERAGIHLLKYTGDDFVEFFRRALDFPRRGVLDPVFPDFADLANEAIAHACGSTHRLQPGAFYSSQPLIKTHPTKSAGVP